MALNKHPGWIMTLLIACALSGCDNFRNWHGDQWANPEYVLKIKIPSSATDIEKQFDPAIGYDIKFLMPDDQWRNYATKYYPADKLIAQPLAAEKIPPVCPPRDDEKLAEWSASDRIPYMKSVDITARRFFWAIPGCKPDQTYVHWAFITPNMTSTSATR